MKSRVSKYLAEVFGTFFLVFAGCGAIVVNEITGGKVTPLGISLAFGLIVMAMIYSIGHLSGAHMNPAVTLGLFAAGRLEKSDVLPYIVAQIAGAILASLVLKNLFPPTSLGVTLPSAGWAQSLAMEYLLTLILMFVIMGVATDERAYGMMAGVAIGGTICLEAIVGGPISGASMNPARSFGPALVSLNFSSHWIYWVGPILGSLTAVGLYRLIGFREESK